MKHITYLKNRQGEIIGEKHRDNKFAWQGRKVKSWRLADLYLQTTLMCAEEYAERARTCSTMLQYWAMEDSDEKGLIFANFCHLRLCPICIARKAKKAAYKLSQVLDKVQADHDGAMHLFLTLTIRNCTGDKLGDTLGQLTKAWDKLMRHRLVQRSIKGWFRALEITRNGETGEFHPHIHAILTVEPGYFAQNSVYYITKDEWIRRWRLALGIDYDPVVDIRVTRSKGEVAASRAAAVEANKYVVKDEEYIDPKLPDIEAAYIVETYTKALHRRRLVAFGGWLKDAAKAIGTGADDLENGDLVHVEKETIRADVADLIEEYHWHFGAGDYVLTDRRPNPLKVVRNVKG